MSQTTKKCSGLLTIIHRDTASTTVSKHNGKKSNSKNDKNSNSMHSIVAGLGSGMHLLAGAATVDMTASRLGAGGGASSNLRSNSISVHPDSVGMRSSGGGGGMGSTHPSGSGSNLLLLADPAAQNRSNRSGSVMVGVSGGTGVGSGAGGVGLEASASGKKTLRLVTYMSPSIPIGLYEVLAHYLEERLNCNSWLLCESRWSAPPPPEQRPDPFTTNVADIGFMCGPGFFDLLERASRDYAEVLGVGAVHTHPYADGNAVYFSDVIIHTKNKAKFKNFEDLRNCRWAYNDAKSLSGCLCPLYHLKMRGEETGFFSKTVPTGSHQNSIQSVLNDEADAAAVDSNVLFNYLEQHSEAKCQLEVIISWGPLPIYPIVINKRLPSAVRERLKQALLDIASAADGYWAERLKPFGVEKFIEVSATHFDNEHEMRLEAYDLNIHDAAAAVETELSLDVTDDGDEKL